MARREFTKPIKREALRRSGMLCEASGSMYGLALGQRCNVPLSGGVEYDHVILDANSKDNSLENCAAVCPKCHKHKTTKHDIPMAAKTVRQQDCANGIRTAPARPINGPPFPQTAKTARRQERAAERLSLPSLPPKQLFQQGFNASQGGVWRGSHSEDMDT